MDRVRLLNVLESDCTEYEELYEKINVIDKDKTNFNYLYYDELVYMMLFIYYIKFGITKLSKNGNIPDLGIKVESYEEFKQLLEKYKDIEFHNELVPEVNTVFDEIWRLANFKLLSRDHWSKVYSSNLTGKEVVEDGKLYISIDNEDLYQFACLLVTRCIKSGLKDFEFKVNNNNEINRTDNVVIYFTKENLGKYLEVIASILQEFPNMSINDEHMLAHKVKDGIAIAKDYKDGSSFTEKICNGILTLIKNNYTNEQILDFVEQGITKHLASITDLFDPDAPVLK